MNLKPRPAVISLCFCMMMLTAQGQSILERVLYRDTSLTVYRHTDDWHYIVAAALLHEKPILYLLSRYAEIADSMQMNADDYLAVRRRLL
ncbi:MAG TPA: hypothetical protein VL307_07090, partial [Chitinophagaceae bacterium]|nr:hypothetical protein [Chitinophagaceae bacterium]